MGKITENSIFDLLGMSKIWLYFPLSQHFFNIKFMLQNLTFAHKYLLYHFVSYTKLYLQNITVIF